MGCLLLFVVPVTVALFYLLKWLFGPEVTSQDETGKRTIIKESGLLRKAANEYMAAQVAAIQGIRSDTDSVKAELADQAKDHTAQQAAHLAMKQAGHKALNVLGIIAADKPQAAIELQAAHDSLNQA